jgi:carboxypeptidase Q
MNRSQLTLLLCLVSMNFFAVAASAAPANTDAVDRAVLTRIRESAMHDEWAWKQLSALTDRVGPRLSGSAQLAVAETLIAKAMRDLDAHVTLQATKVPHWVRGKEEAVLSDYPGKPEGITQALKLTTLGGSAATPIAGLSARVVVVHDFEELKSHAADIKGKIVLFETYFDSRLAAHGLADEAYDQDGVYRFNGPSEAQSLGAAAALVRSVGGANFRLPHTGATIWKDHQAPIPAAALSAEDADLIARLAAAGPVTLSLLLTPQSLPEVEAHNVIADWPGRERADEYVIVSGHLDSWDLATGAVDDGVGVIASAAVIETLKQLDLHPRRTVRFIGWTNEENGGRGHKAYFESVRNSLPSQVAAVESDSGAGRSLGLLADVNADSLAILQPVLEALRPIGATALAMRQSELGADIAPLQEAGVPAFAPLVDNSHYFDYHHTAADTLDKVDPESLRTQVATMATLAFYLADLPEALPRITRR